MIGGDRDFSRSNEPLIISFQPIGILLSSREISGTDKTFWIDDIGDIHQGKSFLYNLFQCILQNCLFQQCAITLKEIATSSS